ncbi:Amino acid/polyamine transporter I [Ascosphaera apis ARSEF 7405]|uniref:Amino acid/polyamine transporter I n=1 Tax=Ascosphaera apis ARSEF 7405 TaxID=392613 RepID=A0A167WHP1_9EURO|nr:Amino acid/polyamine transporter I [Ascosphaera apis ARSEF 7405]
MSMELKNIPSQNQDDKSFKGIEKSDSYDSSVQDADVVAAESAKPVARLERYLGLLPMISFYMTSTASWEAIGASFQACLTNGGPVVIVYGIIFAFAGSMGIACSLAELASILPIPGAQYHWTYELAPRGKRFWSFLQGWLTIISWWADAATSPNLIGTEIQALIILCHDSYVPKGWHATMLIWAVTLVPLFGNIYGRKLLKPIEMFGGILHVVLLPVLMIVLTVLGEKNTSKWVWTEFINDVSGWKNNGVIFSVGLLTATFTLGGCDSVVHMAEEVKEPRKNIPRSMTWGLILNAVVTFGFSICLLYCMGDVNQVIGTKTGYPIIQILYNITKSKAAACVMTCFFIFPGTIAFFNGLASVSRLTWAFARDEGLPFSSFFAQVSPRHKIPLRALYLVCALIALIALINIGSQTAYTAVLSLASVTHLVSYIIPIFFVLLKRIREPGTIEWGPFHMGRWGIPVNIWALCYSIYCAIFNVFPEIMPVTAANMNYAGPVLGFICVLAMIDWFVRGRRNWQGPRVRIAITQRVKDL